MKITVPPPKPPPADPQWEIQQVPAGAVFRKPEFSYLAAATSTKPGEGFLMRVAHGADHVPDGSYKAVCLTTGVMFQIPGSTPVVIHKKVEVVVHPAEPV